MNSIQFLEALDFLHSKPQGQQGRAIVRMADLIPRGWGFLGKNFSASHVENLGGRFGAGTPLNREAKHLSATWSRGVGFLSQLKLLFFVK